MPGKKGGKQSYAKQTRVSAAAVKAIWGQIDITDWLRILRETHQQTQWVAARQQIKGKCPFHQDNDPSFTVDLSRRQAKCFGADCAKYFWDPVRFYKELHGNTMTYHKALQELKDRFAIKLPRNAIAEIGRRQRHRDMKKMLFEVMRGELIDVASMQNSPTPDPDLFYARDALAYIQSRGIKDVHHHLPMGVMPPELRLEKLIKQRIAFMPKEQAQSYKNVWEDAKAYLDWALTDTGWLGALVFFTGASTNDVARLKLRKVPRRIASTWEKQNFEKDIRFVQDEYEHANGVFGLFGVPPYYPSIGDPDKVRSFAYVEGEFDAACIMARQFADDGQINVHVFSGGGASADGLDVMKNFGFETGYIIGDYDGGGKGFIKKILEDTVQLKTRIFEWPDVLLKDDQGCPMAKTDPAEQVCFHGLDVIQRELRREDNFVMPHNWALAQASAEMNGIDQDDIRHLTNVAANWGYYVRDSAEQHAYVSEIAKRFNVSTGQILTEIKTGEENEDAFIERIRGCLAARLQPMQSLRQANSHILRVWDKESKDIYELPLEEKTKIKSALAAMIRKDQLKFIREDVGEPSFLEVDEDSSKTNYITITNRCAEYISYAVTRLADVLPMDSTLRRLGAGLHCVAPTLDSPDEEFRLYLVNGTDFFRGDFEGERLVWRQMSGPCDGPIVIYAEGNERPKRWLPFIQSVADLNKEPAYELGELFDLVYAMVSKGWDFKNHEVTSELLTAAVLSLPIASCVPRQPLFMLTSEQSSGKSSFIGGLIGRTNIPAINIVYPSIYMDNYTVAGVRQAMNHSTLCLCLDEFEDKGGNDRRSGVMRGILSHFRGHSNEEGLTVIGSASGQHKEISLHCPTFVAGIRGLEDPADISRFIVIEMQKNAFRDTPMSILLDTFGERTIHRVRRHMPLLMYRNVLKFREAYFDIVEQYRDGGGIEMGQIARSREHLYSMMAIMKICGRDHNKFIRNYFKQHRNELERVAQVSLSSGLLHEVLYTPRIQVVDMDDSRPKSASELLASDQPEMLNSSHSGVYFDPTRKWLVVHWPTVKNGLLTEYKMRSSYWLRNHASRSAYHLDDIKVERDGVLSRLSPFMGFAVFQRDCSVFDIGTIMKDADASRLQRKAKGWETIDLRREYRDDLDRMTFPKPPPKKPKTRGTSKGSAKPPNTSVPDSTAATDPGDDDDGLNW